MRDSLHIPSYNQGVKAILDHARETAEALFSEQSHGFLMKMTLREFAERAEVLTIGAVDPAELEKQLEEWDSYLCQTAQAEASWDRRRNNEEPF